MKNKRERREGCVPFFYCHPSPSTHGFRFLFRFSPFDRPLVSLFPTQRNPARQGKREVPADRASSFLFIFVFSRRARPTIVHVSLPLSFRSLDPPLRLPFPSPFHPLSRSHATRHPHPPPSRDVRMEGGRDGRPSRWNPGQTRRSTRPPLIRDPSEETRITRLPPFASDIHDNGRRLSPSTRDARKGAREEGERESEGGAKPLPKESVGGNAVGSRPRRKGSFLAPGWQDKRCSCVSATKRIVRRTGRKEGGR